MPLQNCDILIQAGHENTSDDKTGGTGPLGNEIDWTPIVANEAVAILSSYSEGWTQQLPHGSLETRAEREDFCHPAGELSYAERQLPDGALFLDLDGISNATPAGFTATDVKTVKATQFGKGDREDEGTGSPTMGTIQTNSDVVGGSVKVSVMKSVFGDDWRHNDKRFTSLIEVYFSQSRRLVRVPLVDIGPGENAPSHAEVDLTLACDQFLGTQGLATVDYRLLVPSA